MITLKGILEHLTYQNPENHYTVARLRVEKVSDPVTIVGHLAGVYEGESLEVGGRWAAHPKYGDQFSVESYHVILPASVAGIRKYLGSGMIKGIGRSMAEKIVDAFQEKTLDIIENEPDKLLTVQGIGKAKQALIVDAWNTHHAIRQVMRFLTDNGVGVTHAAQIMNLYGPKTMDILGHDPYLIARDIPKIGFSIADTIARNAGIDVEDERRLAACLIHGLLLAEQEGHVFGLKEDLFESGARLSGVTADVFETALNSLIEEESVKVEKKQGQERVYLSRLFRAESGIASRTAAIRSMPLADHGVSRDEILDTVLARLAVQLSDEQLLVVENVLKERIVVITGGPGTGKTTLIRAICEVFTRLRQTVELGAPTGRAARRLSEVTGRKASTLHKLLGYDPENQTFERHFANPLDLDVFIVDEASMVDTQLMYQLMEALPATASLILVGDTFQLPSVGPGNVLADMIESGAVKVFSLNRIFRQAQESSIVMHAHAIRNGDMPEFKKEQAGGLSEFYFIENHQPGTVVGTILELCEKRIPSAFPHIDEIQVLTPMHRGEAGTINLNQQLQKVLNPSKEGIQSGGVWFRPGDKVMHLKNNYEKEVFNGDIGVVQEVNRAKNQVMVNYDHRMVVYDLLELDELSLAYAISVHKSQGSEYPAVIIAMTTAHYPLLQRKLLYTAMTRGRHLVIIVGSTRAVETALKNTRTDFRQTGLCEKLTRFR